MTQEFDKRFIYVANDVCVWEMAFDKRLKYVGIDLHILGNG